MSLKGADLLDSTSRFGLVTPAISLPIFDGGRLRSNLAGRDADYDLAVAQYNKTLIGLQRSGGKPEPIALAGDTTGGATALADQRTTGLGALPGVTRTASAAISRCWCCNKRCTKPKTDWRKSGIAGSPPRSTSSALGGGYRTDAPIALSAVPTDDYDSKEN